MRANSFRNFVFEELDWSVETIDTSKSYSGIDTTNEPKVDPNYKKGEHDDTLARLALFDTPKVEGVRLTQARITYKIEAVYDKYGIEDIDLAIKDIILQFDYEKEGEEETEYFEIEIIDDLGDIQSRSKIEEIQKLPFYISNLEVNMNKGWDPSKFEYSFTIGKETEY